MLYNAVFWICLLILYFSLLKYTYHYNYRSHISLQVPKLAKLAGCQILIVPTLHTHTQPHTHTHTHTHAHRKYTRAHTHGKSTHTHTGSVHTHRKCTHTQEVDTHTQ